MHLYQKFKLLGDEITINIMFNTPLHETFKRWNHNKYHD